MIFGYLRKTEVSDLYAVVVHQKVCGLEVAMDDIILSQVVKTLQYFLDVGDVTLKN
jgi:hypothetical protein